MKLSLEHSPALSGTLDKCTLSYSMGVTNLQGRVCGFGLSVAAVVWLARVVVCAVCGYGSWSCCG